MTSTHKKGGIKKVFYLMRLEKWQKHFLEIKNLLPVQRGFYLKRKYV